MFANAGRLNSLRALLPQPRTVLELGCGACTDIPLVDCFGADLLIGVDYDLIALRWANGLNAGPRLQLVYADITQLPFNYRFDMVVIRHPDVVLSVAAWSAAIIQLPVNLKRGGHALITTYDLYEYEWVVGMVSQNVPSLTRLTLPHDQLAPVGIAGRDRFYVVYAFR